MEIMGPGEKIFTIGTEEEFNKIALEIFRLQSRDNPVYGKFLGSLDRDPELIQDYRGIPCLPAGFFKTHKVVTGSAREEKIFLSSGTMGMERSRHYVKDLNLYRKSLLAGFRLFYGLPEESDIFALMPSPESNPDSSLVFMVNEWIRMNGSERSGFYMEDTAGLASKLKENTKNKRKTLLIGITYALLDFAEQYPLSLKDVIIMETGGMKGRRKEMIREELHEKLKTGFRVDSVHSEYGMTELLSQAYSKGEGIFRSPPWMKVLIRDPDDPLSLLPSGRTGGVNIIDLANVHSCSFIATQDLGKLNPDGSFEILGRFDDSDIRGCSLLS